MDVPLRLTRRDTPAPADAAFVPADGFEPIAAAVVRAGAAPEVFAVRGGFLLVPGDGAAGAVRLRRLGGDLFVPADADLVPALLHDEIAGLTRDRGLVVLPGGTVLAFDPRAPLPVRRWVAPAAVRRDEWEPLPEPPGRAERLTTIERPSPPAAVVEVLNAGKPDGADPLPGQGDPAGTDVPDDARPPTGSVAARAAAAAALGAAGALAWLGRMTGLPGLARLGAAAARKAIEQVPRLSERVLGAQEAALREVLRQLMDGDVEKALRRAPPAFADPDTPGRVGTDANLGTRDPRYDLRSLLGGGGGGGVAWLGGGDVWNRLADQYHRLAREATSRGDFRRAAYLYGVLLRDPRAAANALLAGGLYRDAGVLLRDKVRDEAAAAAAFEQAGDYDEAVRLYDRTGRFEAAGDLLRRIGDEARARAYFTRAADILAARREWVGAGDLIRRKAGDLAAATSYYQRGWHADGAGAVTCGTRLLDDLLVAADWPAADRLFAAAEARYAPPRAADAGQFFHYAREVGELFLPPDRRADLADRVRLLFAHHLRTGGPAGLRPLFSKPGAWEPPVVRDATLAAHGRPRASSATSPIFLADGSVYAVVVAPESGDIVVAARGGVVAWRWTDDRVRPVCPTLPGRLLGLSVSPDAAAVYLLTVTGGEVVVHCHAAYPDGYERRPELAVTHLGDPAAPGWHLEPLAQREAGYVWVTVASPRQRVQLSRQLLHATEDSRFLPAGGHTHLLVRDGPTRAWDWDDRFLRLLDGNRPPHPLCRVLPRWAPAVPSGSSLVVPRVAWLTPTPGVIEFAGTDGDGAVHWFHVDGREPANVAARMAAAAGERFTAACLVAPGQVAAATDRNVVQWLYPDRGTLRPRAVARLDIPARVAALVPAGATGELLAVLTDGTAVRVAPGGRG